MSWENICLEEELLSQKDRALHLEWQSDEVSHGNCSQDCSLIRNAVTFRVTWKQKQCRVSKKLWVQYKEKRRPIESVYKKVRQEESKVIRVVKRRKSLTIMLTQFHVVTKESKEGREPSCNKEIEINGFGACCMKIALQRGALMIIASHVIKSLS